MKMRMMVPGEAPRVRNTAMLPRFSVTSITWLEIILNAATATMKLSSSVIMLFSILMAWNRLPWLRVQSLV